jgi:hypothetical protein
VDQRIPVTTAHANLAFLGFECRGEGWQVAERAGGGDVVGVVAGFDDHATSDPGDQDVRDKDGAAVGRSFVAVLGDHDFGICGSVHMQDDGLETLDASPRPGAWAK